jgi:cellulose biosynthesis protein BcsQ
MILSIVKQINSTIKSSTALNIGKALAKTGGRILLIDLSPDANITKALGIKQIHNGFMDILKCNSNAEDVIISIDGMGIIPSNMRQDFMRSSFVWDDDEEVSFKSIFASLKEEYEHIIIDCPTDMSFVMLQAIHSSDAVILPAISEIEEMCKSDIFFADVLGACIQITGMQPLKIYGDDYMINQIKDHVFNNQKLIILEQPVIFNYTEEPISKSNAPRTEYLTSSKQYINDYTFHLN